MVKRMSLPRMLLLLLTLLASIVVAKSASVLLREGLYAEEVEGDLQAAIKVYQGVIDDENAQPNLKAQALYRQGMCYLKLKNDIDAKAAFNRLMTDHPDQTQLIEKVKPMLEELGNADPASLMPPETIVYLEIGSPGKQIETILKMLEGTPLENPLALLGNHGEWAEDASGPANVIGALLNPSMMAEFKKIRGMGIGLIDLQQNNPPSVIVLFPGKSDALRGLIIAGLGMVSQPGDPIDGMQTLEFQHGGAVAYDDTVIIMANADNIEKGRRLLQWSVHQHKGLVKEPSLASSNKSFAKIGKRIRQDNALTVWFNVNETYQKLTKMMPADAIPQQIHMANGLVDFKNVDDLIASLSIEPTQVALEVNANLKEGHNCVAYNLIRTPRLSKAALKAIPSDAIAAVSIALGEPNSAQAQAVSEHILNATSLDIGRELFANIEQLTLFARPLTGDANPQNTEIPPELKTLGLAITSANPQQTRQIVSSVLRSTNLLLTETEPVNNRYEITLTNYQSIYGYIDAARKTTVFSLSPDVINDAATALQQSSAPAGKSALKSAVNALPDATNKLIMVDLAGAVRFATEKTNMPDDASGDQVREAMARIAEISEGAVLELRTSEEDNSFGVRLTADHLPPIGRVFALAMQIQQAVTKMENQPSSVAEPGPAAVMPETKTAPNIDGQVDSCWADASSYALEKRYYEPPASDADLSASFRTLYDQDNLYVLVDVTDDDLENDSEEFWLDDAVEVFIDADNSKGGQYDDNDFQYHIGWDATSPARGESQHDNMDGVVSAVAKTDAGYRVEIKFPWSTLGTWPVPGTPIGFDVQVSDDDGGGERDSKIAWSANQDDAYLHPNVFGTLQPTGMVAWWKLDESTGDEASDATGHDHTGALIGGPKWLPSGGKIDGALAFDGQNDYVDTGYTVDSPTWTIAAWVKSPAAPSDDKQTGPVHREKNYQINWDHMDDPFRGAVGTCVGGTWYAASFGPLEAGTWYHLAATYNGETLKAYKNGTLVSENTDPSGAPDNEGQTLKLGCHALTLASFAGTVDDVRLYNYALDAGAIAKVAGQ